MGKSQGVHEKGNTSVTGEKKKKGEKKARRGNKGEPDSRAHGGGRESSSE